MLAEYEIGKDIEAGVKKLMAGLMSQAEYDKFIAEFNKKLDELVKKKRADEDWFRYSTTFC